MMICMLEIMKSIHKYVPMVQESTTESVIVDEEEVDVTITQQQVHKILFGGDQMMVHGTGTRDSDYKKRFWHTVGIGSCDWRLARKDVPLQGYCKN